MKDPTEALQQHIEEFQRMLHAQKYLAVVQQKIATEQDRIILEEAVVEAEYRDVERLESLSVQALFSEVLGDKADRLEKERQEYLEAVLALKQSYRALELLQFEEQVLQEKTIAIPQKQAIIKSLLKEQDHNLLDDPQKMGWLRLFEAMERASKMAVDVQEAKEIGQSCQERAIFIIQLLQEAADLREWEKSRWDPDYAVEKTKVDQALDEFYRLYQELQTFELEVEDLQLNARLPTVSTIGLFEDSVSIYHNNLINDWVVKNRISSILKVMNNLLERIKILYEAVLHKEQATAPEIPYLEEIRMRLMSRD